ncbi:Tyrosine-protein kinase [Aphelenchoides besseyi]|nr:Tyrosine-protein kinase [Aphelenchoides besseyi]
MTDEETPPPPKQNDEQPESGSDEHNVCDGLLDDETFHGLVQMEDLTSLLKQNGSYLIRNTDENAEARRILLSVLWNGELKDIEIRSTKSRGVTFDQNVYKNTILELVNFHRQQKIPLTKDGILLGKPVKRQSWELRRENIIQEEKIGEGAFGEVYKGKLKQPNGQFVAVAIKIPKSALGLKAIGEAMKEARIQKDYVHPNVLRLFGVSAEMEPLMIVLEFVGGGSLDKYLKAHSDTMLNSQKATFCFDVTCGLDYLHSRNCIHRDLATRNCLVCVKYGIVKISDFGLSSVGNVQTMDRTKPAPIRWLAPEVLSTAKYGKAADVWSLAIVWWEIFTNAQEVPFKNYTLAEVQTKLLQDSDFHPTMPSNCPVEIQNLAIKCWNKDPEARPTSMLCTSKLSKFAEHQRYMKIPGLGFKKKKRRNKLTSKELSKEQTGTKELNASSPANKDALKPSIKSLK